MVILFQNKYGEKIKKNAAKKTERRKQQIF